MYKQTHILSFIIFSIAVHIIVLAQYQIETTPVFAKNTTVFNIELSSRHSSKATKKTETQKPAVNKTESKPVNKSVKEPVQTTKNNTADKKSDLHNNLYPEKKEPDTQEQNDTQAVTQTSDASDSSNNTHVQQPSQRTSADNQYLQKILSIIESNKYYPGTARRRNMQDVVKVSFSLLESGEIDNLEIFGKYKLLQHAAKTAILESLPFVEPPEGMRFPVKINYSMAFKLTQDY